MKKTRFTEQQIAYALRQAKSGVHVDEITRKMGISQAPSTDGKRSLPAWAWLNFADSNSLRTRTKNSNAWWPTNWSMVGGSVS